MTGGLAQLARAVGSQSTGQGFKSPILHFLFPVAVALLFLQCSPVEEAIDDPVLGDRCLEDIPVRHTFVYPDDFDFQQTQDDIRAVWGEPVEVITERVQGTGVEDGQNNRRYTLVFDGVEFVFFVEDPNRSDDDDDESTADMDEQETPPLNLMVATVLKSPELAIDNGLRVGMLHEDVVDLLGRPIFSQGASHVYSFGDSPTDTMNIELVVLGERIAEIAVSPDFP